MAQNHKFIDIVLNQGELRLTGESGAKETGTPGS